MRPAERVLTCLDLSAAEVPCKTAPFASFSGRAEKEGPARPERGPIYEIVLVHFDKTICLSDKLSRPHRDMVQAAFCDPALLKKFFGSPFFKFHLG